MVEHRMNVGALTVLVVDDDEVWRRGVSDWLGRDGFHVVGCSRGDWVTTAVKTHSADIVVLDVHLPGQSGLEVLRSLRDRWPSLPVIVTTAFGGSDVEATALRQGASAYIEKPFRLERLVAAVRQMIAAGDEAGGSPAI
jgi:DNA-binding response OmpR family regulator